MKGRVACQMSQNELIITELIFRNILTELEPAEIAALMSALVFQEKTDSDPKLTKVLEKVCSIQNSQKKVFFNKYLTFVL